MKTALIQTHLAWEDSEANRNHFEEKINSIDGAMDLIVLPEMFTTGFTMNPAEVAETMDGKTVGWLQQMAALRSSAICGSVIIKENGHYHNRLIFARPDGKLHTYDKRHLFTLAGEHTIYTAGNERLTIEYNGWQICILICYDLRFPVFSRNTDGYDLLIYVANWPEPRIAAWDALLKARAIENMSYVMGVNRIGKDANGHNYPGHSQIVDMLGQEVANAADNEMILLADLDKQAVREARSKFSFLDDRDNFRVLD